MHPDNSKKASSINNSRNQGFNNIDFILKAFTTYFTHSVQVKDNTKMTYPREGGNRLVFSLIKPKAQKAALDSQPVKSPTRKYSILPPLQQPWAWQSPG
ncbi:MAG: hypothetical protein A2Z28_05580 [Chloroflexi bacterium RBG_16_51_9]|nr:MAG: hypothetical protein A2Z28_05580 [Chloroflexi bacterium RBG_16_51_9]